MKSKEILVIKVKEKLKVTAGEQELAKVNKMVKEEDIVMEKAEVVEIAEEIMDVEIEVVTEVERMMMVRMDKTMAIEVDLDTTASNVVVAVVDTMAIAVDHQEATSTNRKATE